MPPGPRRGELRISVPIGYIWHREIGLGLDPDLRIQEVVRLIFIWFRRLGSARQVLLAMLAERTTSRGRPTPRTSSSSNGRRSATAM